MRKILILNFKTLDQRVLVNRTPAFFGKATKRKAYVALLDFLKSIQHIKAWFIKTTLSTFKVTLIPTAAPSSSHLCYDGWCRSASEFLHLRKPQSNCHLQRGP
jgi:hypothetical protein